MKSDAGRWVRSRAVTALPVVLLLSCARPAGPPPIALGTPCAACGMEIQDLRFACERQAGEAWRVYDSIECLLGDGSAAGRVYLADYDRKTLHHADSLWVVRGGFPSPMGGGYAAFLERPAAEEIAGATRGRVGRLGDFAGAARVAP